METSRERQLASDAGAVLPDASGRYLAWYLGSGVALVLVLGLVNFAVDPLQLYRRASYAPVFSENQRYQNPGLARSYDYETVIIGTSHAENFTPGLVQEILGERAMKLAISGSSAYEQRLVLETAIATGRVRHVLWLMDHIAFKKPPDAVSRSEGSFPFHLYRQGPATLGLYLLSLDSLRLSLAALAGRGQRDLETLNTWHRDHVFSEARVLKDWQRRGRILDQINLDPDRRYTPTAARSRAGLEQNLLPLAERNPEIRFDLVFPPYSILSYLADLRAWDRAFAERQAWKAQVVAATARFENVRVFDFQAEREITHDLDRYKDLEHFDLSVNRFVLEAIRAGRQRVDADSHAAVLAEQARQLEAYRAEVCAAGSSRPQLCPHIAERRH